MKTLHLSIIIFSFMLILASSQIVFGSQPCPTGGYIHYGPSRQSIPCYLVTPQYNPTFEEQFGNPTQTKLVHDNAILILNQTTKKLVYKGGENIFFNTELINIGNKTVDIAYWEPEFFLEIKNQTGNVVWPQSTIVGYIPEYGGIKTLKPGEQFGARPWTTPTGPMYDPFPIKIYAPGNYTVISLATLTFDTHTQMISSLEPLWSKPLQITVVPEFSSATTLVTGNQTTNQSSLQEQVDLAKQNTEGECLGGAACPAVQKLIEEKENNQKLILVLAIGIPIAVGVSIIVLLFARKRK